MSSVRTLTERDFDEFLAATDLPVLVDFGADWCPPCRTMEPILESVAAKADGRAVIARVDVDAEPALASRFGVQSLPTMIVFVEGDRVVSIIGAVPESRVFEALDRAVGRATEAAS